MTQKATPNAANTAPLASPAESYRIYTVLQRAFLLLMLAGYAFYPFDLWVLDHWMDSWQSRIPFMVALPSVIFTVLMLFFPRVPIIRQTFIILMILNMLTGILGATFHFFWNFEGEIEWTFKGIKDALQGTRPVLAPMAFTHIGFTGLLCSMLPNLPTSASEHA